MADRAFGIAAGERVGAFPRVTVLKGQIGSYAAVVTTEWRGQTTAGKNIVHARQYGKGAADAPARSLWSSMLYALRHASQLRS